jgi:hypothetical protein
MDQNMRKGNAQRLLPAHGLKAELDIFDTGIKKQVRLAL